MAKPSDLHTIWAELDNSRLTAKQYSFRLPVHVAAQLAALCDIYPNRTRTELVGNLLASALEGVEQSLPQERGDYVGNTPSGEKIFEIGGLRRRFHDRATAHFQDLERELGNKEPGKLF